MKTLFIAISILFSFSALALRRPIHLEIDGQAIEDAGSLIFTWETEPVLNDFKEIKINGKALQPYILHKGQTIFLRVDDGTGDYRMDYLRNGPERRVISCEAKAVVVPQKIKVSNAAMLKFGEAVLASPLEDQYKVGDQSFNYYLCVRD